MLRHRWLLVFVLVSIAWTTHAQIDPDKRRLAQFGYNQPIEGQSPLAAYAFYYLNDPSFIQTNLALRLVIAPVYLDSELGFRRMFGARTDLGLGVAGGGFVDSYSEVRRGDYIRGESFTGHGAEVNSSLYHRFNPDSKIPLYGVFRGAVHESIYQRDSKTDAAFVLPEDQAIFSVRAGFRYGGMEPLVIPALAMEISGWYENSIRSQPGQYGFGNDRELERLSHLFWTRSLLAYTFPKSKHNFSVSITAGGAIDPDRLSAYRLGGMLPLIAEYPLNIPGYYFQELTAKRFILFSGQYMLPLDSAKCWYLMSFAGTALIDYLNGLQQPGAWHSGVGGGITYQSPSRTWLVVLGYGYGIDAIRSHGRGANSIGLFCQIDLEAHNRTLAEEKGAPLNPSKFRGFDWILGR